MWAVKEEITSAFAGGGYTRGSYLQSDGKPWQIPLDLFAQSSCESKLVRIIRETYDMILLPH